MRLPDVLGVFGALVVGGLLAALLLASALGGQPVSPTPPLPTMPPLPSFVLPTAQPSAQPTAAPSGSTVEEGVAVGQHAPPIEVTLLDGSVMNTTDFVGKPMWINFMATWCPQCQDELPMMRRYANQLGQDMTVLVVDVGEDRHTVRSFMTDLGIDLNVGVDQDGTVQRQWGVYALPVHFWLDEEGIVREIVYGGAPREVFIDAITAVVPGFSAEDQPTPSVPLTLAPETASPEATPEVSATP